MSAVIAETCSFALGRYTVWQRPRPDNPAWAVFVVYVGTKLIGKSFSRPDLECCRWLERSNGCYAEQSAPPRRYTANDGEVHAGAKGTSNGRNGHRRA